MKSFKSLSIILAGALIIVALLSFRNSIPKNEYLIIQYYPQYTVRVFSNGLQITEVEKVSMLEFSKILDAFGQEGWSLKAVKPSGTLDFYYLERTK